MGEDQPQLALRSFAAIVRTEGLELVRCGSKTHLPRCMIARGYAYFELTLTVQQGTG